MLKIVPTTQPTTQPAVITCGCGCQGSCYGACDCSGLFVISTIRCAAVGSMAESGVDSSTGSSNRRAYGGGTRPWI
ncbi:MAG: hypothetical protein KJ648_00355 [Candidatus Omnitrophica bacterium]|nr:hypothetical protein [Candidatus Omnitrophota bacterium]